jgi:hypothetical protein
MVAVEANLLLLVPGIEMIDQLVGVGVRSKDSVPACIVFADKKRFFARFNSK